MFDRTTGFCNEEVKQEQLKLAQVHTNTQSGKQIRVFDCSSLLG